MLNERITVNKTYPEYRVPTWALNIAWDLAFLEKKLMRGLQDRSNPRRWQTYHRTLEALHTLAHTKDLTHFNGLKVHKLMIAAARDCEWWAPEPRVLPPLPNVGPGEKMCRRCEKAKPLASFRSLATPAQKLKHGWSGEGQYFIQSLLCTECRSLKQKAVKRKQNKRQAPSLFSQYAQAITVAANTVDKALNRRKAFTTPDGFDVYNFRAPEDEAYYRERRRLTTAARVRFDARVEEGALAVEGATGAWHDFLTPEEREELKALHEAGSWMQPGFRGRIPKLWEEPVAPRTRNVAQVQGGLGPEPAPDTPKKDDPNYTDWDAF